MLNWPHMNFVSSQDVLFIVSACSILVVSGFLCKVLYELAKLIHQTNDMVEDTREKVSRVENAVVGMTEKLSSASQYLGFIAEGGKQLMSFLHRRNEKEEEIPRPKKKGKTLSRMPDEDEE